jgi:hypothetical protein
MRSEEAVDRLLQGLERLEGRLARIEGRLKLIEETPPPEPPPSVPAGGPPPEERPDPFMPAVVRAPASRHMQAVSRALSMLGLVPEEPEESEPKQGAKYKAAMQHALEALRGAQEAEPAPAAAPAPTAEAPATEVVTPPVAPAEEIAREIALPDPTPPPAPAAPAGGGGMFRGALRRAKAAAARLSGLAPAPVPEEAPAAPASAPARAAAPAPASVVPPPEVVVIPAPSPKAAAQRPATAEVDLGTALQIDLERPVTGVRDYAAPILNALVLLAAAGGALYAGGAITQGGPARDAWPEIATGLLAVASGAAAWFWRGASSHVRAFLAGTSALLLNVVLLVVMPALAFPDTLVGTACGLVAFLGLRVVLETRHPLALFVGFGLALLLPHWFAPDETLRMHFVAAVNVATAVGALRLHRLQATVAAAALSAIVLHAASGPAAVLCGGVCAATYVGAALLAPVVLKRKSYSAAALAALAFVYAAWTVHVPYVGPGWFKAAVLFGVAAAAALVAVRLPLRQGLLRGVFKASALLLLLAALPAGLEEKSLAPSTLFLALLFAVFALALRDAFLRAAGSLMLVVTIGLFHREGAAAPLLLAASAVATTLCATSPEGPTPRTLVLLLGGAAHGLLLFGLARVLPGSWVGYAWISVALAMQAAARRFPLVFLEAGATIAAAAAAFRGFAVLDPIALGASALAFLALGALARRTGLLFVAELLAVAALSVAWPGPLGVLYALPLLALLPLPWPVARAHGRALAIVLVARSLAPDVLLATGDLRTAVMAVCAVASVFAARGDRRLRIAGLLLATAVVGAWVRVRTGRDDWALWAAAVALALGFLAAMPLRRVEAPVEEAETKPDAAAAEADTPGDAPAEAPADAPSDQPSAV